MDFLAMKRKQCNFAPHVQRNKTRLRRLAVTQNETLLTAVLVTQKTQFRCIHSTSSVTE